MTLINNHVLFAISANRKTQPEWSRAWRNELSPSVTGAEARQSLRVQPLVKLSFVLTPVTLAELLELNECVLAATKSGLACAPYHGRSSQLQAEAAATDSITVDNSFAWAVGDWIFLPHFSGMVETRQLTAVNLTGEVWTLEFDDALTETYAARTLVWPLLFGEFAIEEMNGRSPQGAAFKLTLTELVSARTVQVGEEDVPSGAGIGVWRVEDDFVVQ